MKTIKSLVGLLKGLLLKIFPFLGYRGVVNQQIRIYKKFKKTNFSEDDILNIILESRRKFTHDIGSDSYYQELISIPNKNLEQSIMAILEWEYLSNMRAYKIRGENNIPLEFIESYRQEMYNFIHNKVLSI